MEQLRKALTRAAGPVSLIGAVGGFIGDIIAPLGNFAPWIAGLSLVFAVITLFGFLALRRRQGAEAWDSPVAGALLASSASTVIFGFWSVIFAVGPDRGYLAENVAPIATVQAQLLNLQEDVTEIKETTGETATQVVLAATAQAQGFADIQAAFAALQAGGGSIVANPQTPQEWYSNARLYQLRGDTANTLKAYEGYFTFNLEYVDPYQEYTALLKAAEGIARARQIISAQLNARPDSLALELTFARLLDTREERLARLTALATRAPQFGPVFFELGEEYTQAIAETVTGDLLKKQSEAYTALLTLEEQQLFSRYYIDKSLAEKQLDMARKNLAAMAGAGATFGAVDIQVYYYYNGVQFIIVLPEAFNARQLLFSIDDPAPKTDAGKNTAGFVNTAFGPIPVDLGEHTFYMQYVDANGVSSQIYSQKFRVDPIAINFQQLPKDFSTNTIPGLFNIGILGATGVELYTYNYSLDNDSLSEPLSGGSFMPIQVTGLTPGEHVLYIQATAQDGQKTEVVKFDFTVK